MKRIFLALLLAGTGVFCTKAQSVKFIAEAGINGTALNPANNVYYPGISAYGTQIKTTVTNTISLGFYAGVSAEVPMGKFSLDPGLHFLQTTYRSNIMLNYGPNDVTVGKTTDRINYLELPVNLLYHFNPRKKHSFFVGAGPYVALALSGNEDSNNTRTITSSTPSSSSYSSSAKDIFTGNNADHRSLSAGINTLIGVTLSKNFRVSGGFDLNFTDPYDHRIIISPSSGSTPTGQRTSIPYSHTFKVSIGYAF